MVWEDKWKQVKSSEEEMWIAFYTISLFREGFLVNVLSVHLHNFGCSRSWHFPLRFIEGDMFLIHKAKMP